MDLGRDYVYVVGYQDGTEEPVISVFNNEKAAKAYQNAEKNNHDRIWICYEKEPEEDWTCGEYVRPPEPTSEAEEYMEGEPMDTKELLEALNNMAGILLYFERVSKLPDCNTCSDKSCEYRPKLGESTRINCPLWKA